jgi:hypothetical protein
MSALVRHTHFRVHRVFRVLEHGGVAAADDPDDLAAGLDNWRCGELAGFDGQAVPSSFGLPRRRSVGYSAFSDAGPLYFIDRQGPPAADHLLFPVLRPRGDFGAPDRNEQTLVA